MGSNMTIELQVRKTDMNKLFPIILIIVDFLAAIGYALSGDLRKTVYWICAGLLTITVTF